MHTNLYQVLRDGFLPYINQTCLQLPDGKSYSYAALDRGSARFAALLQACLGEHQARILVQIDKSPEAVMVYLACLRCGYVYVPLNTAYTLAEVRYFITDSEPALVICDPANHALITYLKTIGIDYLTLDSKGEGSLREFAENDSPQELIVPLDADALACILYTSGTTGRAKGAMLTHQNLISNALALHAVWQWQHEDILIHALPIFHVHGLFIALHSAFLSGSKIWFLAKFEAQQVVDLLPHASVLMGVPTFYHRLLQVPLLSRTQCRAMRLFISGSAPLLKNIFDAFERLTGMQILERYGMSEAGIISSNPVVGERRPESVGFALPNVEMRITDDAGQILATNEIGRLEIKGPNVFKAYWRKSEATAASFNGAWFITGDLARMDVDGRLSIVGREKDLIISGGYNVYPKEIEQVIDALPQVLESAVIGAPHADLGEAVIAIVATHDKQLDADYLLQQLQVSLARFKQPKKIILVTELPRNAMGKVQKARLREEYRNLFKVSRCETNKKLSDRQN